ncbi:glycosyltransferase [Paenibacillus dendritiformis]|uniref:glycosyltransferase n=1 Tax=Paenibacillus dendritiformis TaxID=130049 RepID=UPI00387E1FD3
MNVVSVIIPVYNGEVFLEQAINSILSQTYPYIEIIIVDDGSTDATPKIAQSFRGINYFRQENKGPSAARNIGVKLSSGKYIAMMDADDLSLPTRIEEKVEIMERNSEIDFVYCDVDVIDGNNEYLYCLRSEEVFNHASDALAYMLYRQFIPNPVTIISRRECFEQVPYPEDLIHGEDYYLTMEWAKCFTSYYYPKVLYQYRRHGTNLTNAHLNQVKAEIDIVKNIGIDQIEKIVASSRFTTVEKDKLLAKIMLKIKDYERAEDILSRIVNKGSEVFFLLGVCQYQRHSNELALKSFESALEIESELAEGWNNMGCSFGQLNMLEQAKDCFKKAISIRPEYMDAKWNVKLINSLDTNDLKLTTKPLRKVLTTYETSNK